MSDSEQFSNWFELDLISLLVNFSCELKLSMYLCMYKPRWILWHIYHKSLAELWFTITEQDIVHKWVYNTLKIEVWFGLVVWRSVPSPPQSFYTPRWLSHSSSDFLPEMCRGSTTLGEQPSFNYTPILCTLLWAPHYRTPYHIHVYQ